MKRMSISGGIPQRLTVLKGSCLKIGALVILLLLVLPLLSCAGIGDAIPGVSGKIPVIFDTDICDDIDDTWALALLLQSGEFDVKMVTTAVGNTEAKAKVVAKYLEEVGRTDIPVGIGVRHHTGNHRHTSWAAEYDLDSYPGRIHKDGVRAMIDVVMKSRRPIKIVAVGPLPNVAQALKREPRIAGKAEFVGMHGSVRRGYGNSKKISAEYNVRAYAKAAKVVFAAPWRRILITPLDTCGIIHLKGEKYKQVFECDSDLTRALIENYRIWYRQGILNQNKDIDPAELERRVANKVNSSSSTLFDTVAIYLAMTTELTKIEELPIQVTDDGYTRIVEGARMVECATEWKDLSAFEDYLVERLTKQ